MWLTINPLDVWMFRDGKPFTSGDSHIAQSLFPPSAFTIQGMLRWLLIEHSGVDWDEYRGRGKQGNSIQQSAKTQALLSLYP